MFQGLRTVIYNVSPANLKNATEWYTKILGKKPYFEEVFYVGFSVGGFELGLHPVEEKIILGNSLQAYWGVPNIGEALAHCLQNGAKLDEDVRDVGGDIKVATVRDPFGNLLGLIQNPNFKADLTV